MDSIFQYINGPYAAAITGAAVATAVYFVTRSSKQIPAIDLNEQSEELSGADRIRVSRMIPKREYLAYLFEDAQTLYECMLRGARVSETGLCMGWRGGTNMEYIWITYREAIERAQNFGSGLAQNKLKSGSFVGIYSQNSVECVLAEQACYSQSMVIVPLYDTLGPHACTLIISEAEISTVVCDAEDKVSALLDEVLQTPTLRIIIVVCDISEEIYARAQAHGVRIIKFTEVEAIGKKFPHDPIPPFPQTLATVCYTSGTTGNPKGVMLTHGNIIANVCAVMTQMGDTAPNKNDIMISFLPLAHMFERCCQVAMHMVGGRIGFFQGNIRLLSDDIKALKPTVMPCVPSLLNKLYNKVQESVMTSQIKKVLVSMAVESKKAELNRNIVRNNSLWDWLVFKPIRDNLGGRMRLIVVGSAPLAGQILTFLRCALGCHIVEGYGQTECVAPCTLTIPRDPSVDHVGPPIPCCSVKLVDVPDMNYFASKGQGEVCVKGLSIFQGYLKDSEKTQAALDKDGWLHTGDIGMWLPNGTLKILDRKKHIFKLAQGEYVVPEKIENIYIRCPYISQIFVHGESLKSCLVGIIVPEKETVIQYCKEKNIACNWTDMCENQEVKAKILCELTALGKKFGLKSFEQVKDIYLFPGSFSVDDKLLTPTLKTRRKECKEFFSTQIEQMYGLLA